MLSRAFYADQVAYYSTEKFLQYGAFYPNFWAMLMNYALEGTSFETIEDIRNSGTMNTGINRYDMAQLMTNIMKNNNFSASSFEKNVAIAKISDYNGIPGKYKDAVANVYALGIIGGYADGSFGGNVTMNRGQAAIVIYRMMQKMYPNGEVGTPDPEVPTDPSTIECKCNNMNNTGSGGTTTTTPIVPEKPGNVTTKTLVDSSAVTEANVMRLMEARRTEWGNKAWGNADSNTNVYPQGNLGDIVLYLIDGKIRHITVASGKDNVQDFGSYTVTNHGEYTCNAG